MEEEKKPIAEEIKKIAEEVKPSWKAIVSIFVTIVVLTGGVVWSFAKWSNKDENFKTNSIAKSSQVSSDVSVTKKQVDYLYNVRIKDSIEAEKRYQSLTSKMIIVVSTEGYILRVIKANQDTLINFLAKTKYSSAIKPIQIKDTTKKNVCLLVPK